MNVRQISRKISRNQGDGRCRRREADGCRLFLRKHWSQQNICSCLSRGNVFFPGSFELKQQIIKVFSVFLLLPKEILLYLFVSLPFCTANRKPFSLFFIFFAFSNLIFGSSSRGSLPPALPQLQIAPRLFHFRTFEKKLVCEQVTFSTFVKLFKLFYHRGKFYFFFTLSLSFRLPESSTLRGVANLNNAEFFWFLFFLISTTEIESSYWKYGKTKKNNYV